MLDPTQGAPGSNAPEFNTTAQATQQPERQRFEELLQRIGQAAKTQEQENPAITVQAGRPVIYKGIPGQDPASENIPTEAIQKVLQAVEDPQAASGTVKFTANGEVAFYNQKGDVSQDTYKLANQQATQETQIAAQPVTQPAQATAQPVQGEPVQASTPKQATAQQPQASDQGKALPEAVTPAKVEPASNPEQLQGQIDQLEAVVARQQQQLRQLEQRTNQIGSAPILAVNNKLGNWLEDIRGRVGNTLQQTTQQLTQRVQQDTVLLDSYRAKAQEFVKATQEKIGEVKQVATDFVGTSQSKLEEVKQGATKTVESAQAKLEEVKQTATNTVQTARDQVQSVRDQVGTAYNQAVDRHYAAHYAVGTVAAEGVRSVGNAALKVATTLDNKLPDVTKEPSAQPAAEYKRLTQSVDTKLLPSVQAKQVAQAALKEQFTTSQVQSILSESPKFKEISSAQGPDKANQFAGMAIAAAQRQNSIDSQAQKSKQHESQSQKQFQA